MATETITAYKDALYAACQTLYSNQALVAYGSPGPVADDDIVSIGRVTSRQDFAALGLSRPRDAKGEVEVVISSYRGGGPDMEQVCFDRVFSLLATLETYIRTTNNTLGVAGVLWSQITDVTAEGSYDPDVLAQGRVVELTATISVQSRL
jgi:hypothetical protein